MMYHVHHNHIARVRNRDIDYRGRVNNPKGRTAPKKKNARENEEVVLEPLPNPPDLPIEQLTVPNILAHEKKKAKEQSRELPSEEINAWVNSTLASGKAAAPPVREGVATRSANVSRVPVAEKVPREQKSTAAGDAKRMEIADYRAKYWKLIAEQKRFLKLAEKCSDKKEKDKYRDQAEVAGTEADIVRKELKKKHKVGGSNGRK